MTVYGDEQCRDNGNGCQYSNFVQFNSLYLDTVDQNNCVENTLSNLSECHIYSPMVCRRELGRGGGRGCSLLHFVLTV